MQARSLHYSPYIPRNASNPRTPAKSAAELFHRRFLEYSDADRESARKHLEHVFGSKFAFTPRAHVLFRPPENGPVAEDFSGADNRVAKFRRDGYVGWQLGMDTYFNGWKAKSSDKLRMVALTHEFAHVLFAKEIIERRTPLFSRDAYLHATEGIATYAERECLRAYGYQTPILRRALRGIRNAAASLMEKIRNPGNVKGPKTPDNDEIYEGGLRFFTAIANRFGVKGAFLMLSSDLPRTMDEIHSPSAYTYRVLGGYC